MRLDERDRQNLAVGLVILGLIGVAAWVMSEMSRNTRLEDCLRQRRRNCEQVAR